MACGLMLRISPEALKRSPPGSTSVVGRSRVVEEDEVAGLKRRGSFFDAVVRATLRLQRPALHEARAVRIVVERADAVEK